MFTYKEQSSDGLLRVLEVRRSVLPPSQIKLLEVEGKSGARFISKRHGVRQIEVKVAVIGNLRPKVRQIADWLDADKPEALILPDEPHLTDFAILEGDTDIDEILDNGFGTLTFLCPEPFSVGIERTVSFTSGITRHIVNEGTAPTFPIITATANTAMSYFIVSRGDDIGNNDMVTITAPFNVGDVIIIDCQTGKVTINGTLNMQTVSLDSEFWSLVKNNNYLWTPEGFSVVVKYNERFK